MPTSNIVPANQSNRPRAIAKEKDGIVMYWVDELQVAGLTQRGLMRLLQTESATVRNVITSLQAGQQITLLEVETVTEQGLRTGHLITESDLPKVLRKIEHSKAKESTRELAGDVRDKLAAAGFKLAVMLELAPQQLAAQAQSSAASEELEIRRLDAYLLQQRNTMFQIHSPEIAALICGKSDQIVRVETVVTEVVNPETNRTDKILSAEQLKRAVKDRTGSSLKSLKSFADSLRKAGRDDLLVPVTRNTTAEYVDADKLDEAIAIVYGKAKQLPVTSANSITKV